MTNPVEVWLWLLLVMKPYNSKTIEILEKYDYDATEAAKAIRDGDIQSMTDEEKHRAEVTRTADVQKIMDCCSQNGVRIIALDNEEYPEALKNIFNPPIVLFVAGNLENLNDKFAISVVGTRHATTYAYRVTDYIVSPLAKLGTVIVSGLAYGLDSAAHTSCLNSSGTTVGVCACGILVDYPAGSGALKRRIIDNGGAVISELLPFDKTSGEYFKYRNRIISGLSHGTLVVEAGEKSGCFLTAGHALEQGREVFAVPPHNVMDNSHNGTSSLIRDGAIPVFSYTDILYAFYKDGGLSKYFNFNE